MIEWDGVVPWGTNCIEDGDDSRYVDRAPYGDVVFRYKHRSRKYNAVEDEGDYMGDYLPYEEETVYNMNLFPQCHFLHQLVLYFNQN